MTEDSPPSTPERRSRSVSQLTSYSACGERYRLERRTDAPERPAAWLLQGTAAHLAIELWETSGRTLGDNELHELYLTEYRTSANELLETFDLDLWLTGGRKKAENDLTDREELGWWQVKDYQRMALEEAPFWEVIASEQEFLIELYGVPVRGFIDQVRRDLQTGELYPVDVKSGTRLPPSPVQLATYRLALQELYPDEEIAGDGAWVKLGRPASSTGKTQEKPTATVTEDLIDWTRERVGRWMYDMDRAESQGIYLPNPDESCTRMCSVSQYCRVVGTHMGSINQYAGDLMSAPAQVEEEAKA